MLHSDIYSVSLYFIFSASNFEEVQIEQGCKSSNEAAESSCFAESEPNNGKRSAKCFKAKVNLDEDTPMIEEVSCSNELSYLCTKNPSGKVHKAKLVVLNRYFFFFMLPFSCVKIL